MTAYIPNESHYAEDYAGPWNIWDRPFDENPDKLYHISVDSSVTAIPNGEFAAPETDNIRELYVPNSVTSIGPYAFQYIHSLKKLVLDISPSVNAVMVTSNGDSGSYWFYPLYDSTSGSYIPYNKNLILELPRFTADDLLTLDSYNTNLWCMPWIKLSDGRYYRFKWEYDSDVGSWVKQLKSSDTPIELKWHTSDWEWYDPETEG